MKPLRVAFHAINGVGLGHLVRAVCLSRELRALERGVAILVLTTARDTSLLEAEGLDYLQMPPRLAEPHADPARAGETLPEPLELAALSAALSAFAPDLVIFDTHAPRALVDLARGLGARLSLVLRELRPTLMASFLGGPDARAFDRLVSPHEPGEVALPAAAAALPLLCIGPVVRAASPLRARSPERSAKLVVAVAGGGGQPVDAARFCRAVADAHWLARARIPSLRTLLVPGPYGRPPAGAAAFAGLEIVSAPLDLSPLLSRASLVVAQAGYNTIAELRLLGLPAVLVPGVRRSEDQRDRARSLARLGAAVLARPDGRSIANRIEALLSSPGRLAAMRAAHATRPLVPRNREVMEALARPVRLPARPSLRVALVAHDFPPRKGGMETFALEVAEGLSRRGREVFVYTTRRLGAQAPPGVTIRQLFTPLAPPGRIDLFGDLPLALDALARDTPDAVHLCHAGLAPWVPYLRAALPCRVTVSVHGNDLVCPWVHHGGSEQAYRGALARGLAEADRVLPVSAFSAGLTRAEGVERARIRIVPNGVDPARFCPESASAALARGRRLLTVSRLAARKGHETVVRALPAIAREFPDVRYAFTGHHGERLAELRTLARSLGVEALLEPLGVVPDAKLPALYRSAEAFVLVPEERDGDVEGFGIALLEAAASGLPTVASRVGGVPEAVADGVTGLLVAPGDPAATAAAIKALLGDPARARALGEAGRMRACDAFTWERTCDAIEWALAAPPRRPRVRALSGHGELIAEGGEQSPYPHVVALRRGLRGLAGGAALGPFARDHAASLEREREVRLARYRRATSRGKVLRLRATGEGERLLAETLRDCDSLGLRPEVEMKLRSFLDPAFRAHGAALVAAVHLLHTVPSPLSGELLREVRSLGQGEIAKMRSLRIFLAPGAIADPAAHAESAPEVFALREALYPRGVVVVPPPELMRYLSRTPAGGPETAMIEPTNRCNLSCPTCPTGTGKIKPLRDMTPERFEAALEGLGPRLRNLSLWNYGEPTLNRHLPAMVRHAKERGVGVVKISSNAHFLRGDRGRELLASGLDVLILSVDGASEATYQTFRKDGSFARVAEAVAALCTEKKRLGLLRPRIELQFIAMKHNEHELSEIHALSRAWGVDRLRIKTFGADDPANRALVPASRTLSRYREDRETPTEQRPFCTMAWDHAVINVDGKVTPCCYLRPDMGDEFVMGNAFETPFPEIWRGARYQAFRTAMLRGRASMRVCGACRGGTHDLVAETHELGP